MMKSVSGLTELFQDLLRLNADLLDAVDSELMADCDVPLPWFELLRAIDHQPACRVFELAEELSMTTGGVSKLVDRIEAAGLCVRRPHPQDRRSSVIELTTSGRRDLECAAATLERHLTGLIGPLVDGSDLERFAVTAAALRSGVAQVRSPGHPITTAGAARPAAS